ncbi:hypothetical protein Tco_1266811 [Tanacetum coccineum]
MEECHKLLTDQVDESIIRPALSISKMKAAFYPDVGLEQMVSDQMWIEEECKYDIAAMTHMRILSVVRIEVFSLYGYDYIKKIVLRRADLKEYTIAERDFKYLYPSDFEDLYLLNLHGHLDHLPPEDKKILTTAVNLWTINLVIRQRVEDLQLGIESYQMQLNLTKPRWDATGFEFKNFKNDKSSDNQNHPKIQEYFEQNDLKAQLQAKNTVISKLKETILSLRENENPAKVKKDIDEIETIIIELEYSVEKILYENEKLHKEKEHLKKTYKKLYDSNKPTRVRAKEQCDALIVNLNSKSMENADLKAQIQEKFSNDHIAKIMGYGDYQIRNVTISRVYYVEGLRHNLFSVGQFCDSDLEVVPEVAALVPKVAALVPTVLTGLPSSTSVDQDAPSPSTSQNPKSSPSHVIPPGAEEADHDIEVALMDNNPQFGIPIPEPSSEESSSQVVILNNVHSVNQPPKHIGKWIKDHPIDNVIGDPSRTVSTRHQLQTETLFCYFDAFLFFVEPKSYKEALT